MSVRKHAHGTPPHPSGVASGSAHREDRADLTGRDRFAAGQRAVQNSVGKAPQEKLDPAAVLASLGCVTLINHPNATEERVRWIAKEAPGKRNPAAWAASAVRGGWNPPQRPSTPLGANGRTTAAERSEALASFDALPPAAKEKVEAKLVEAYPNLSLLDRASGDFRICVATFMLRNAVNKK